VWRSRALGPTFIVWAAACHCFGCFVGLGTRAADPEAEPDDLDGGGGDAGEAGLGDGGASSENLHSYGTFEEGCGAWNGLHSTRASDPLARSGSQSCRVCATGEGAFFTVGDRGFLAAPPPGRYRAEAWIRAAPGAPAPVKAFLHLRTFRQTPDFEVVETKTGPFDGPDDVWRRAELVLAVTQPAERLNVYVAAEVAAGACFLLDDVIVVRLE
jgi:hypothetical protein